MPRLEAIGLLDVAFADIVARTKTPVTVDLKIKGFEEVSKGIDAMLLSAADFMPYDKLLSLQDAVYARRPTPDWRAFLAASPGDQTGAGHADRATTPSITRTSLTRRPPTPSRPPTSRRNWSS